MVRTGHIYRVTYVHTHFIVSTKTYLLWDKSLTFLYFCSMVIISCLLVKELVNHTDLISLSDRALFFTFLLTLPAFPDQNVVQGPRLASPGKCLEMWIAVSTPDLLYPSLHRHIPKFHSYAYSEVLKACSEKYTKTPNPLNSISVLETNVGISEIKHRHVNKH